jgi:toxin ParE1/3/4
MTRIIRTYTARDDLRQIWAYIAHDNMTAADQLIDEFERTLHLLARNPQMGQSVEEYRAGLRRFTVGNYLLFYEPIEGGIRLVRVLHGARRMDDLFH